MAVTQTRRRAARNYRVDRACRWVARLQPAKTEPSNLGRQPIRPTPTAPTIAAPHRWWRRIHLLANQAKAPSGEPFCDQTSRCQMPLDPAFENDDLQPWWQMGPPLRITVHPASPPNPQSNGFAASQGMESDGYPNDWVEPDGYPDDWIAARPAPQGVDNTIAPAK